MAHNNNMNTKALALLGLGHMMVDLNTGALPALLPFLKTTLNLSYTMIGTVVLVASLSSSLIQPIFGHLSDRSARPWLLPFGVFAATCGMAAIGLAASYQTVLMLVCISGIGIASYHPEAYKTAYLATGEKKATGISLFSVGGNIGYGLGPLAVALCLTMFGQIGLLLLLLPGLLASGLLLWSLPWLSRTMSAQPTAAPVATEETSSYAFLVVLGIVSLGACVHGGLVTYVPLYFSARGENPLVVGSLLSLLLIAGAIGTLIAGPLSDRIGHKKFLIFSMGVMCPLIALFLQTSGFTSMLVLTIIGMCISPIFSVTLVIAQTLMRGRLGVTAGLMTGVGIGVGGLGVAVMGRIADLWGVESTMQLISIVPLLPWALVFLLPTTATRADTSLRGLRTATVEGK
ncbi:MAG: MFS transporter [Deltaproteobacteria bacterium]|nr:MFS transporter [Deltaproteobacteria bacterium]